MTSNEWIEMFRRFPPEDHSKLVVVMQNGAELCVDTLFRFEKTFAVVRGRLGGTIEEARAFFVPYDQMQCVRIERTMRLEELESMFGQDPVAPQPVADTPVAPASARPTPTAAPTDPATASRLLMERIRTLRAVNIPSQFASQS